MFQLILTYEKMNVKEDYGLKGDKRKLIEMVHEANRKIKRKKRVIEDIKIELAENHDILSGDVQSWINDFKNNFPKDLRELCLYVEQVYSKTGDMELNPENFFTDVEIKEAHIYKASDLRETIDFPVTLPNMMMISQDEFAGVIDLQTIDTLLENQLLIYDYELQREAVKKKMPNGEIRIMPKLLGKKVDEICAGLLDNTLKHTEIVFNAQFGSSETGEELEYSPEARELTINKGTKLAILDGFHRCRAAQRAVRMNPDIDFKFRLYLTNFTIREAQEYQVQLSKATPINAVKIEKMSESKLSDKVANYLERYSDLKGRVSETQYISGNMNEIVSYKVLRDAIEDAYNIKFNYEVGEVQEYLSDFFNTLFGMFPKEFITDVKETARDSLINDNNMFYGYIHLAKRFKDENIGLENIKKVIEKIDFSRDNKEWIEMEVLQSKHKLNNDSKKVRRNIAEYFKNLDLKGMIKDETNV